jgi:hypothetical protein
VFTIQVFEARSLNVTFGNEQNRAAARLPIRLRRDNTRWRFDSPISARASKLALDTTIVDLNALRVKNFNPPAPANPPSAAPTLRVSLEGTNRHETLFLGEAVRSPGTPATPPAPAPAGTPPATEYYAQLENREAIFTVLVKDSLVDTLRNAQVQLREKRLLELDPRAVNSIVLSSPLTGQPPLTLQRLDGAPSGEGAWQVRRGEGAQGPQTMSADPELVQRLLLQLASLSALRFESDAPSSADLENWGLIRPAREIALGFAGTANAGESNAQPVVQLGTSAAQEAFARVGTPADPGNAIYAVPPEILRELRLEPITWRHRLVQELPAASRITAIKITDLAREQVLLETTLDAAGQPAATIRAPDALKALLAQLRKLQARRFVQDAFTDRVAVGGNDLPWRFRLEATVALPGVGAEQNSTVTWFFTERGAQQLAGSREIDAIFEIDQPLVDALWPLTEGLRDPGPPPPVKQ